MNVKEKEFYHHNFYYLIKIYMTLTRVWKPDILLPRVSKLDVYPCKGVCC